MNVIVIVVFLAGFAFSIGAVTYFFEECKKDESLIMSDAAGALAGVVGFAFFPFINFLGALLLIELIKRHKAKGKK